MVATSKHQLLRTSTLTDGRLVQATLDGKRELFAVLMRRYNRRVFRVARGILRSANSSAMSFTA